MSAWAAIAIAMIAAATPAQQTWKVNCNGGPGVHFTDVPQAVAAAGAGDTILVYFDPLGCNGAVYTAPTIDKALSLVGFTVGAPPGFPTPTIAQLRGVLTLLNIPAGQRVVVSNFFMSHSFPFAPVPPPSGLHIVNCAGVVLLEDFRFRNSGQTGQVVRVENSPNVVLRGCDFALGGAPLEIIGSNVLLTTTAVYHNPPISFGYSPYPVTAAGLALQDSSVTIVGSYVVGSDRVGPLQSTLTSRPGVTLQGLCSLRIGPASFVSGGLLSGPYYDLGYYAPAPANSTILLDSRATLREIPAFAPFPTAAQLDATYHAWVVAGEPYIVSIAGPSNGFALLVLGNWMAPVASPFGELAFDPLTAQAVDLVALPPPAGAHDWHFTCPATAANAHAFVFQALTLSPSGVLGLTIPSPLTVGWRHGQIP